MRDVNIGPKIRQFRLQAGLTQVEFASRIGVTNITVSKWQNERQSPSLNRMAELRRFLGAGPGGQLPGDCLLPSTGAWLNQTRVAAVMTGVVMSLETGVSVPGTCGAAVDSTPPTGHATIGGPGPAPDVRSPHDARDATVETGDETTFAPEEILDESVDFDRGAPDLSGEYPPTSGVSELIDFDPHDPGEHPALSGVYVLYDISERPLYVGQGKAIDKRLRDHTDKFWFRSPIVETAAYVQIDDRVLRERVEAVLIKFLKSNAVINKKLVDR